MRRILFLCVVLCTMLSTATDAKKKPFGDGLFWEVTADGTLFISGQGDMPDFKWHKIPWRKSLDKGLVKKIVLEEGIVSISKGAFCSRTSSVEEVVLPNTLRRIGINHPIISTGAFEGLSNLKSIRLNEGLEFIGDKTFDKTGITVLKIPNTVEKICKYAFPDCLKSIELPNNLKEIDIYLFSSTKISSIVIPEGVTVIREHAFAYCRNLERVKFPQSLKKIEEYAFSGCNKLILELPENIEEIGYQAFGTGNSDEYFKGTIAYLPKKNFREYHYISSGLSSEQVKNYFAQTINSSGKVILSAKEGRKSSKETDEYDGLVYYNVNDNGNLGVMDDEGVWRISTNRGYKQIESFRTDSGKKLYIVSKSSDSGPYGLVDDKGDQIVPMEMDEMKYMGNQYVAFKVGSYWGVMTINKQIIVPTSRNYTFVGRYISTLNTFSFTKTGYRGECDRNGKEISLTKVETPVVKPSSPKTSTSHSSVSSAKPNTSSSSSASSTASSSSGSSSKNSGNSTTTIHVEHHRDPVPVQEWVQCGICYGDGKCNTCFGTGSGSGSGGRCLSCGYSGKCRFCNGQGGRYQTVYR